MLIRITDQKQKNPKRNGQAAHLGEPESSFRHWHGCGCLADGQGRGENSGITGAHRDRDVAQLLGVHALTPSRRNACPEEARAVCGQRPVNSLDRAWLLFPPAASDQACSVAWAIVIWVDSRRMPEASGSHTGAKETEGEALGSRGPGAPLATLTVTAEGGTAWPPSPELSRVTASVASPHLPSAGEFLCIRDGLGINVLKHVFVCLTSPPSYRKGNDSPL